MISFAERTKPRPPFRLERLKRASVYICFLLASPILQSYLQNSLTRLLRLHNMRYYEQKYPEVDELVMVQVRQIAEMGAYVKLV